ncbi:hypothetical protein ASF89_12385 [Frigoribacterium sp. Leaf172]|nr:hypothetical protein ASF89_12385 [Frigoribacterium sp. Leaf172]
MVHLPAVAVRRRPTLAVPLMTGVLAVRVPFITAELGADDLDADSYPLRLPVTRTVNLLPTVAPVGVIVFVL